MTIEQKWAPFDYQRYLDGDEVYYRSGEKFEGEIFCSKKFKSHPLICFVDGKIEKLRALDGNIYSLEYRRNETNINYADLVMKPKTKKLWIAVSKENNYLSLDGTFSHGIIGAYEKKEKLIYELSINNYFINQCQFIEIEIEA
jgi:hypothetical protein